MSAADDRLIWSLPTGSCLVPRRDLHEDFDQNLPRWFTAGRAYTVESMHPIANPPFVMVRTDDGGVTRLYAEHIRSEFRRLIRKMEDIRKALIHLSESVEEMPCHWFSADYTDAAIDYCRPCAEMHQAKLRAKHPDADPGDLMIDGGWATEHDSRPYCDTCNARLIGHLTEYGVQEEVRYFTDDWDGRMTPETAADLLDIIEHAPQPLLDTVRAALAAAANQNTGEA